MKIVIDGTKVNDKKSLFKLLKEQIPSDEFYGNNLDALYDVLTDLPEPADIEIKDAEALVAALGKEYSARLMRVLRDAAMEQDREDFSGE